MKVEEELMHAQCECLMKESFLAEIFFGHCNLEDKILSLHLESSKSISGHDDEEKYKDVLTLRQQVYQLSSQGSGRDIVVFKFNVFEMVSGFHY
jgi:hypothetical protein